MPNKIVRMLPTVKHKPGTTGSLCPLASAAAPFVYFDRAPNFGFNGAVANISLEVIRFEMAAEGADVVADRVTEVIDLPAVLRLAGLTEWSVVAAGV